jgi:hypothetical protein
MPVSAKKGVTNGGTIVHCHTRAMGTEEERYGNGGTNVYCEEGNRAGREDTEMGDRDRYGEGWGSFCFLSLPFYVYPCHVIGMRTSGVYEQ